MTGHFNNISEVLHVALRLPEDQGKTQALKLQRLRAAIQAGEASGPGIDAEHVFDRLESKYKSAVIALDAQQSGSLQSPPAFAPLSLKERK
jgi:antitoxin ParD1/3/4